jgi:hypothetical protein
VTLTDVGRQLLGPGLGFPCGGAMSVSSLTLNDSDNSVAGVHRMPKAGTIDRLIFSESARTGTSSSVLFNIGAVTVDTSGNPTSTPFGGSALETRSVNALTVAQHIITLATPATVAKDDIVAGRIWPEGTVAPDGTQLITVRSKLSADADAIPYSAEWATAWTKDDVQPMLTLQYSDGEYVGVPMHGNPFTTAFGSGSAPNEYGALFTVPYACTCIGMGYFHRQTTLAATGRLGLYDNTGTLQRSSTYPAGAFAITSTYGRSEVAWSTPAAPTVAAPIDLAPSTNYRIGHLATSADTRQHVEVVLGTSAQRASLPQGTLWQKTTRSNSADAGSWTETNTTVPMFYLILSHIDFSLTVGGGGTGGQGGLFY